MLLFHGSNVQVSHPKILVANRALDFGAGFYTTSDEKQAIRWAQIQTNRSKQGNPTVSVFEFTTPEENQLSVLRFQRPNIDWLNFVAENRKGLYNGKKHDIVIGPVANDMTMPVISDYLLGTINARTALYLLRPQKLSDQFAFLTVEGLATLTYKSVKYYD